MEQFLKDIIKSAGLLAKDYFSKGVKHTTKSNLGDLVTEADIAVNNFLIQKITSQFPDHHIHSEESKNDINPGGEFEWVIDPIDGTRNFAMGISFWCNLVAVMKNGEPYLAAVYNPLSDELFFAKKDHGATLNGFPIKVNEVNSLDHSFGCISRNNTEDIAGFNAMAARYIKDTKGWLHSFGTMLPTCHVAMGGIDFCAFNCGWDHDYLAPALICSEAGALVTNAKGEPWKRGMRDIIMANPNLHPKVLELFR